MAAATEAMITRHGSTQVTELNEFVVPKILGVNLKKKAEDRSMTLSGGGDAARENGGDVNKQSEQIENAQKNLPKILGHETDSPELELDIDGQSRDEEDASEMAPERRRDKGSEKQSSYLLQPFLKPVAQRVEGNPADNPILKALFGVANPQHNGNTKALYNWIADDRPATNNCHPFKKTELSRDILNDSTPVQVPKSLTREKQKSPRSVESSPNRGAVSRALRESPPVESSNVAVTAPGEADPPKTCESPPRPKSKGSQEKENRKPMSPDDVLKRTLSKVSSSKGRMGSITSLKKIGYINSEKLMKLRTLVDNAIKNHKVYSMTGCYSTVRNALKQRGWIEKIDSDIKGKRRQNRFEEIGLYDAAFQFVQKYPTLAAMRYSIQSQSGFLHNDQINYSGQGEAEIINRMLRNINEDLCWLSRPYPYYCWKDIGKYDLVNRLPKAYFSNKIGLCNSLQHIQWYFEPGVCSTQYPRTYNMSQKDEYEAFKDDFRMTACIGLLKWLTTNYRSGGERAVRSAEGKVDACMVDFALKRCTEYIKYREHEDIDLPEGATVWEYQWDHFITQYYKVINEGHLLKECKSDPSIQVYVTNALAMLNLIKAYWPQINIDGYQNFWVVKPGGRCCGNGIVIKNNLEHILMMVHPTVTRETRYVVQKYIERPLLIYNTKFDIRQWFLVTSVYPLTVWMYRESYLRFCSQPFSLKNTHESIHLCNNAVQRRYKNSKRDRGLPDENMWDCYTFQTYLKSIGQPDAWEKHIYPGMKEGFIGALLASQDTMERRKNCFELYGADFMISDTLTDGPWLIEINSNPAMDSSTSVTARMCPQVLEDIVKVVIDRRDDKNASTGAFELVYKQHCPPVPPYLGMSLSIKGQKVHRSETEDSEDLSDSRSARECRTRGDFVRSDALKRELVTPNFTSEMLEGLRKEILRAKLSVRMVNVPKRGGDDGPAGKLQARSEELETGRGKVDEVEEADTKEEEEEEIQIICEKDVIEIVAPKSIYEEDTGGGDDRETPKRSLSRIVEGDEDIREEPAMDDSAHNIYVISSEEFRERIFREYDRKLSVRKSCIVEVCPEEGRSVTVEEVHPVMYVTTFDETPPVENPSTNTPETTERKEQSEDYDKYIIKQEVKKEAKKTAVRKTSWKTVNGSNHKRRWKSGRKKVDYVQKNIQEVRGMQERPRLTYRSCRARNATQPGCRMYPVSRNTLEASSSEYEDMYQEELLKMLHSMDSKKFVQELCGSKLKHWMRYLSVRKATEEDRRRATSPRGGVDVFRRDGESWKANESTRTGEPVEREMPAICSEIAVQLGLNGEALEASREDGQALREGVSCPNLGLRESESSADTLWDRTKPTTTTTVDLRANIESARRACSDILAKLREFNEANSKVRLQQALRHSVDNRQTDALRGYRAAKGRKHLSRGQGQGRTGEAFVHGLEINAENGAVRRVERSLPRIQPWGVVDRGSGIFGWTRRE